MLRLFILTLSLSALVLPSAGGQDTPASARYKALLDEYEQTGGARIFAKRFLEFGEQHSQDPAGIDALLWVVQNVRGRPETDRALDLLAQRHIKSEKLGPACNSIANSRSLFAEKLLRAVLRDNPHERVRAQACYALAALLDVEAGIVEQLTGQPELAPRVLQYYGADYGRHLSSLTSASLEKEREQVYQQLLESFSDVELQGETMGKVAQRMLFRIRNLSIGRLAPEIEGEDTHGKPFKLSDFRGKVVMLTFWGHW